MKMKIEIRLWMILVVVGVILALTYTSRTRIRTREATISALESSVTTFVRKSIRANEEIAVQKAIVLRKQDAIEAGLLREERLKELNMKSVEENVKLTTRVEVLEREASFVKPPVIIYKDTSYNNVDSTLRYIQIPTSIKYEDKWASLYATVDYPKSMFDTISFISVPEITLGWQKQGFLKRAERTVIYTNENPYVTVLDMQNVIIEEPKKWWQTDVAKVSAGIVAFEIVRNLLIPK